MGVMFRSSDQAACIGEPSFPHLFHRLRMVDVYYCIGKPMNPHPSISPFPRPEAPHFHSIFLFGEHHFAGNPCLFYFFPFSHMTCDESDFRNMV